VSEPTEEQAADIAAFRQWCEDAVGMDVEEVKRAALEGGAGFRITRLDGVPRVVTQDYKPFRVNVHVENGKVVKAYGG
jgi:hypothetical protein